MYYETCSLKGFLNYREYDFGGICFFELGKAKH